jgi:hypothetical protein
VVGTCGYGDGLSGSINGGNFLTRVPPSSGSSSLTAAILDYLTDEDEATTISPNVTNHLPSVTASHAIFPNPQTQIHYNIKSQYTVSFTAVEPVPKQHCDMAFP